MSVVPRRVDPLSNHQLVWHSVLFELPLAINNRAGVVKSKDVPYHQHRFCEERETSCDRDIQVSVLRACFLKKHIQRSKAERLRSIHNSGSPIKQEDPPNLSILLSGGKETNKDSLSKGD